MPVARNYNNYKYKVWRDKVLKRDEYKCQHCGTFNKKDKITVHHIFKWWKYKNFRYDIRNDITLCRRCHDLYDNNESIIWQVKYRKLKEKYNNLKKIK